MSQVQDFKSSPIVSPNQGRATRQDSIDSDTSPIHGGSSSAKRRASRAGTRSVTTLSSAQLERKRANDREAQRAIRARTKETIEQLTKQVNSAKARADHTERLLIAAQHRIRQLEDELTFVKTRASAATDSFIVGEPSNEVRQVDSAISLESDTRSPPDTRFLFSEDPRFNPQSHRENLSSHKPTPSSSGQADNWAHQPRGFQHSSSMNTPTPEGSRATSSWRGGPEHTNSHTPQVNLLEQHSAAQDRQQWPHGYMLDASQQQATNRASPGRQHPPPQQLQVHQYKDNQSSFSGSSTMTTPQPYTPSMTLNTPASEFQSLSMQSPGDISAVSGMQQGHRHSVDLQNLGSAYTVAAGPATPHQDYHGHTSGQQQQMQHQQQHQQQIQMQQQYVPATPGPAFGSNSSAHAQHVSVHYDTSPGQHSSAEYFPYTAST